MPLAASGPVAECPTRLCPFGIRAARLFRLVSYPPRCNGSPGSLTLSPGRHFLFFSPPAAVSFPPNPTILLRASFSQTFQAMQADQDGISHRPTLPFQIKHPQAGVKLHRPRASRVLALADQPGAPLP